MADWCLSPTSQSEPELEWDHSGSSWPRGSPSCPAPRAQWCPPGCRHQQSPVCKAFRHVKVDTLSQPEALSRISVPGRRRAGRRASSWPRFPWELAATSRQRWLSQSKAGQGPNPPVTLCSAPLAARNYNPQVSALQGCQMCKEGPRGGEAKGKSISLAPKWKKTRATRESYNFRTGEAPGAPGKWAQSPACGGPAPEAQGRPSMGPPTHLHTSQKDPKPCFCTPYPSITGRRCTPA